MRSFIDEASFVIGYYSCINEIQENKEMPKFPINEMSKKMLKNLGHKFSDKDFESIYGVCQKLHLEVKAIFEDPEKMVLNKLHIRND